MDLVSVIMSTYNEPVDWIKMAIDSILGQSYSNLQFIIVVDNPQYVELRKVLQKYQAIDSRVEVLINEKNIGLVGSLNKALTYCKGKYIARMDADDISYSNRIELQVEYIKRNDYDLVAGDYEYFRDDQVLLIVHNPVNERVCSKFLRYKNCTAHPTWLVKKEVYDVLKGYREIDACEDYDFLVRVVIHGYKLSNLNRVVLKYRDNPKSISHEKVYKQKSIMNFLAMYYRKGEILELSKYKEYMSTKLEEDIESAKELNEIISNIKDAVGARKKINLIIIGLCTNRNFRKDKIINQKIKLMKILDSFLCTKGKLT